MTSTLAPMTEEAAKGRDGNQTLARGLRVLLAVADSRDGMTVAQVAEFLDVHRSIAHRVLQTLADFGLVLRGPDGAFLPGPRLASLSDSYLPALREVTNPVMRALADRLQSTISLFVEQDGRAVAIAMIEPTNASHHLMFRPGMRTPLDRGAAGYALLAAAPPQPGEPEAVTVARERGYAQSHAEIEEGQYAVAAWIPTSAISTRACLNLITYREDVMASAGPEMRRSADQVARLLRGSSR